MRKAPVPHEIKTLLHHHMNQMSLVKSQIIENKWSCLFQLIRFHKLSIRLQPQVSNEIGYDSVPLQRTREVADQLQRRIKDAKNMFCLRHDLLQGQQKAMWKSCMETIVYVTNKTNGVVPHKPRPTTRGSESHRTQKTKKFSVDATLKKHQVHHLLQSSPILPAANDVTVNEHTLLRVCTNIHLKRIDVLAGVLPQNLQNLPASQYRQLIAEIICFVMGESIVQAPVLDEKETASLHIPTSLPASVLLTPYLRRKVMETFRPSTKILIAPTNLTPPKHKMQTVFPRNNHYDIRQASQKE